MRGAVGTSPSGSMLRLTALRSMVAPALRRAAPTETELTHFYPQPSPHCHHRPDHHNFPINQPHQLLSQQIHWRCDIFNSRDVVRKRFTNWERVPNFPIGSSFLLLSNRCWNIFTKIGADDRSNYLYNINFPFKLYVL